MLEFSAVTLKQLQRDREAPFTKFRLDEKLYCTSFSSITGKKEPDISIGSATCDPLIRKLIARRLQRSSDLRNHGPVCVFRRVHENSGTSSHCFPCWRRKTRKRIESARHQRGWMVMLLDCWGKTRLINVCLADGGSVELCVIAARSEVNQGSHCDKNKSQKQQTRALGTRRPLLPFPSFLITGERSSEFFLPRIFVP